MHTDDFFRFLHHLGFCNPQGCLGNRHSEVVNFDTVELTNGNLDRVELGSIAQNNLVTQAQHNSLVLQATQRQICFCQEVTRTTSRV